MKEKLWKLAETLQANELKSTYDLAVKQSIL